MSEPLPKSNAPETMAPEALVTRTQKKGWALGGVWPGSWSTTAYQNVMVLTAGVTMNVLDKSSQPYPLTALPIRTAPDEPCAVVGMPTFGSVPAPTQVW